jgi:hypothetical protein
MIKHNRIFVTLVATVILTIALTGCGKTKEQVSVVDNSKPQKETTVKTPEKVIETSKTPALKKGYEKTYPEKDLSSFVSEEEKIEYLAAKFVFDDLIKKFENKETLTVTNAEGVMVFGTPYDDTTSMICDLPTLLEPDSEDFVWDREAYEKFIGFDVSSLHASYFEYPEENIKRVDIRFDSNLAFSKYENDEEPLFEFTIKVSVNDDGTFTYQSVRFDANVRFRK